MKYLISFTVIIIALTACQPAIENKLPTPTQQPTSTFTSTPTPKLTITPTETQTPIPEKTFSVCKIEKYKDCVIYDGSSIPEAINALGQYQEWLQTLSKPFDLTKLKLNVPFVFFKQQEGDLITYNASTSPNFNDPATRPFRRDVTAGVIYIDYYGDGKHKVPYLVRPIEFYDKNDPQNNKWVVILKSYYGMTDPNITYEGDSLDTIIKWDIDTWKHNMNTTPILTIPYVQVDGATDPLVQEIFNRHPDMSDSFQKFVNGDIGALSQPGIALLTEDYKGGSTFK